MDDPSDKGDYELINTMRYQFPDLICAKPIKIDAKLVGTNLHHPIDGIVAISNVQDGFYCQNIDQPNSRSCLDFEVRFCCPEGKYTTTNCI